MNIAEIARLISEMTGPQRSRLAVALVEPSRERVRCPAVDFDTKARCVRDDGHDCDHVGANGASWLVALRCQLLGQDDHGMLCDRIEGHDGACVPQPRGSRHQAREPLPPPPPPVVPREAGTCVCGAKRVEHFRFIGGCGRTGCTKYVGTTPEEREAVRRSRRRGAA